MEDIKKLALCSEMAQDYGSNYEVIDIEEYYSNTKVDLSFHPNGNCGCILLNDWYAFGIRCDHLMWAEGCCEGGEYFWTEHDHNMAKWKGWDAYNMIIVYGNHKGTLIGKLLVFHKTDSNEKDSK